MKVKFFTKNIDKTFYRQIIHTYINDQLEISLKNWNSEAVRKFLEFRDSWEIRIYRSREWNWIDGRSENTGILNPLIPHGVTGEGIVNVYILDINDKGLTSLQNFSAIFHELSHMLLMMIFREKRGILRNDDLGGNKAGKEMNVSTQEVHDRMMENKNMYIRTWINTGSWFRRKWTRYTAVGIDLRDYINAAS